MQIQDTTPRGPLYLGDRQDPDKQDGYLERMRAWREHARTEAIQTARLNKEVTQVPKYIAWLMGEQWDPRRARYRSRFFDNRLDKARIDGISTLTSGKPTIEVTSNVEGFEQQAEIATRVIQYEWLRQSMDLSLANVIDISYLWGTAFWKISAARPGVSKVIPCGPDNVMPIQPGWNLQESAAVLYETWKPVSYFHRVYPTQSAGIESEAEGMDTGFGSGQYRRPDNIDEYTWNSLNPRMRRDFGIKAEPSDMTSRSPFRSVKLQEFYIEDYSINESKRDVTVRDPYLPLDGHDYWYIVKPGQRLYPRKRLVVFGGRRLMYDGPSPFWHGLYPFECLRLNKNPWSFWGTSKYRNLLPLNEAINEVAAGTLDLVKRALNPTVVVRQNAISKTAWDEFLTDAPGKKLMMNPMGDPARDIRYMELPVLPQYVTQMMGQFLMPEFDRMAGQIDIGNVAGKKQIPGGDTIEQMRDSQQVSSQLESRYVEEFLRGSGVQALSNVFQFYTGKQRMRIMGLDGLTMQDFDYNPDNMIPQTEKVKANHWRNYSMMVVPGSMHSGAGDRKKLMSVQLFGMGGISRKKMLRDLDEGNVEQIESEILQEMKDKLEVEAGVQQQLMQQQEAAKAGGSPDGQMLAQMVQSASDQAGGPPNPSVGDTPRLTRGQRNGELV